jgi:hypothetical protein
MSSSTTLRVVTVDVGCGSYLIPYPEKSTLCLTIHFAVDFFYFSLEHQADLARFYRLGGCDFGLWSDNGTTPSLRQLLIDLRDKV